MESSDTKAPVTQNVQVRQPGTVQGAPSVANDPDEERAATEEAVEQVTTDTAGNIDEQELREAVTRISDFVQNIRRTLNFSVSEQSGQITIDVIDSETEEIIRQIPPEDALLLSENIGDSRGGILLQTKV